MRQLTRSLLIGLVLATLALAAGCGDDGNDEVVAGSADSTTTTVDPDTAVSSPPVTIGEDPGSEVTWTRIEPTDDLVNPGVATPEEIVVDPDDPRTVLVRFYGGVQECYGARAAVVSEDETEVRIRLEFGSVPGSEGVACIEIAEAQELALTLDAPVGDRDLVAVTS
jgi:hypothetical protein